MTKYRSREIVEAVQWFPGVKVEGVYEIATGKAVVECLPGGVGGMLTSFLEAYSTLQPSSRWCDIEPGQYVVTKHGAVNGCYTRIVIDKQKFEGSWEDIGG